MTVLELRAILDKLDPAMEVMVEVTNMEGDHEVCDLQTAITEVRCDEVECLYLHGDQGDAPSLVESGG